MTSAMALDFNLGARDASDGLCEHLAQRATQTPMSIVHAMPPEGLFERVAAFFKISADSAVFCWGSTIYVPSGRPVPSPIIAHEHEHYRQQTDDVEKIRAWWDRWLADPEFRLAQELPAHAAEYRFVCKKVADPNERAKFLINVIAARLAHPMYGKLISHTEAIRRIRELAGVEKKRRK